MNYKELTLEDFKVGDIWLKKDGHKMEVYAVKDTPSSEDVISFSGSVQMKLFVHKSSPNFTGKGEVDENGDLVGGTFSNKFYFLQYFNFEDKIASKWSILEGYKKQ